MCVPCTESNADLHGCLYPSDVFLARRRCLGTVIGSGVLATVPVSGGPATEGINHDLQEEL